MTEKEKTLGILSNSSLLLYRIATAEARQVSFSVIGSLAEGEDRVRPLPIMTIADVVLAIDVDQDSADWQRVELERAREALRKGARLVVLGRREQSDWLTGLMKKSRPFALIMLGDPDAEKKLLEALSKAIEQSLMQIFFIRLRRLIHNY